MRARMLVLLIGLAACDNAAPGAGSGSAGASGSAKAASKSASASVSVKPAASSATPATTSAAPSASEAVAGAGPDLVFEGLKLLPANPDAKDNLKFKSIEVKPDGSVATDTGESKLQFAKNELKDDKGNTLLAVAADGTITGKNLKEALKFNDKDEIVSDEVRIYLDNGVVKLEDKKKGKTEDAPLKLEGVTDKNKRAALLLATTIFLLSEPGDGPAPGTSASSSAAPPASATAAPPKPPK